MPNKCKKCSRKTLKSNYPLCLECWKKEGSPKTMRFKRINPASSAKPSKEEFIRDKMQTAQWGKMGHWERAGKGGVHVDTSPGGEIGNIQAYLLFLGIVLLFAGGIPGIIVLLIAFLLEIPKSTMRKKYLAQKYDRQYTVNQAGVDINKKP